MFRSSYPEILVFAVCCVFFVAGCTTGTAPPVQPVAVTSSGGTPVLPSPPPLPRATQKNLYVVQASSEPMFSLVFPLSADAYSKQLLEIPGSHVSLDGAGNIYVLDQKGYPTFAVTSINVYSAALPTGKPVRSLPVGPGTRIANVTAMAVSKAGEIFVNDGNGVAVFSATANGDVAPDRYIQELTDTDEGPAVAKTWALYMAVDGAGNLYLGQHTAVIVFGPKDTGAVYPTRVIAGSLTRMGLTACSGGSAIFGMTVNDSGALYVLYRCQLDRYGPTSPLTVYVFDPTANGNVAPVRWVTTPGLIQKGASM